LPIQDAYIQPTVGPEKLRVSIPGLAAFWPQAKVAADIATSLEAFLEAQRQNVSQGRELPDAVDLDQRLCLWILRLCESLDQPVIVLDLLRHLSDLLEHRTERPGQTWREHGHASLREAERGRGRQTIAARLSQSAHGVHRSRPQTNDQVTGADQRQCFLLSDCTMGNRTQDLRIEPRVSSQLLRVHLIALPIAMRDRTQFAHVRHYHFVTQFLKLLADPDRMASGSHGNSNSFEIPKALVYSGRVGSEAASVYDLAVFVECAVMAPDVAKVDADRELNLGLSAWDFSDGVPRWLLHGKQSFSDPEDLLIPFVSIYPTLWREASALSDWTVGNT
jgi:hypothetical protein